MFNEDTLVSVIILAESNTDNDIYSVYENVVKDSTHRNLDIIISTFRNIEDTKEIQERCSKLNLDTRWVIQKPSASFIEELTDLAAGEVIFYKSCNNVLWYPRHIESHLESFNKDKSARWALSHIENKNVHQPDSPFNTLSWRIDNPPHPDSISIDEVCHLQGLKTNWSKCLVKKDDQPVFYAGYAVKEWIEEQNRGTIPSEITVIQWVSPNAQKQDSERKIEDVYAQVGVPAATEIEEDVVETEEGIEVVRKLPTVVGNYYLREFSESVLKAAETLSEIETISIKRTIGMGDVILVEPIIKKLREKYTNAKITLYTASPKIVNYFVNKPDNIEVIPQNSVVEDTLHNLSKDQLKIDLDLSYESRENKLFIESYAEVCGIEFDNDEDRHVQLTYEGNPIDSDKYAVVCADGSGWPGKTWGIQNYETVIKHLKDLGYKVYETGSTVTDESDPKYHECELDEMVNLIAGCSLYVGADNGPMHVARGFDKPCVAINGAALTYLSNPNRKNIFYVENKVSPGFGIKHRQFFNVGEQGITFVPYSEEDPTSGLNEITCDHVIHAVDSLIKEDDNSQYAMNMGGVLVKRDVLPGFVYRKDSKGNYHRDRPFYHPDQRVNISSLYNQQKETIWKTNFAPLFKDLVDNNITSSAKVLDVGCNMGIFVDGMIKNGYTDVTGFDLNRLSIETGKEEFEDIKDNLQIKDITGNFDEGDYDVIVCSDVLSYVSDPKIAISNLNKLTKINGFVYLNNTVIDNDHFSKDPRGWSAVGNGECITLFTSEGLKSLLTEGGFEFEDYGKWNKQQDNEMLFLKCKKVS